MNQERKSFNLETSRKNIQESIDRDFYSNSASEADILQYLENPYNQIVKKYTSRYEESWKNVKNRFLNEATIRSTIKELY